MPDQDRIITFIIPGSRTQEVTVPADITPMPTIGEMLTQLEKTVENFPSKNVRTWIANGKEVERSYRPDDGEQLIGVPQNKGGL